MMSECTWTTFQTIGIYQSQSEYPVVAFNEEGVGKGRVGERGRRKDGGKEEDGGR